MSNGNHTDQHLTYWLIVNECNAAMKVTHSRGAQNWLVFSESELTFAFAICRHPSVCLSSVVRLSPVVCNVRAPYSGDWNFRQCFYSIWYLGHLWAFGKNFTEIVPEEPLRREVKPKDTGQIGDRPDRWQLDRWHIKSVTSQFGDSITRWQVISVTEFNSNVNCSHSSAVPGTCRWRLITAIA